MEREADPAQRKRSDGGGQPAMNEFFMSSASSDALEEDCAIWLEVEVDVGRAAIASAPRA